MKRKSLKATSLFILGLFIVSLTGCGEDPVPVNDEEVITTLKLTFDELDQNLASTGNPITYSFADPDGDGGNNPVVDNIVLKAASVYNVTAELLNESVTPTVDITPEITLEGESHQIFYEYVGTGLPVFNYLDFDKNNKPIGVKKLLYTEFAGSGTLTVTLRHLPDKNAEGVSNGDITNAGGATDFVTTPAFSVTIN
ncbi:MAG: hypothetical protein OEY34_00580 [Cyclobacteriaceae bacterium]|nr:hypothetical protein [Cyclobacteriaceae bacterium]